MPLIEWRDEFNTGVAEVDHEHQELIALINDQALMYLEAPVKRVTGFDVMPPYFGRENSYLPSAGRVRRAIEETLDFN